MPDNRIRLKQLYTPELSGYVVTVSSGEKGSTGPIGPTGLSGTSITGAIGAAGPSGAIGPAGATGPAGSAGAGSLPSGSDGMLQYNNAAEFAGTSQIFYDDTGHRVGLNTLTPSGKISFGTYSNSDNSVPHLMLYDDSTKIYRYGINYNGGLIKQFVATGISSLGHSFGSVTSKNEYTEHVRIGKDGKVGIQCTAAEVLDVNSGNLKIRAGNVKITGKIGINVDPTDWALDVRGNVKINPGAGGSGYLGVGGIPSHRLHVYGDSVIDGGNLTIGKTGIITSQKVGGNTAFIYVDENDDLVIRKSNQTAGFFVADAGGNIGIKHASPAFDLDMSGSLGIRILHSTYPSKAQIEPDDANIRLYNRAGVATAKITASGNSYLKGTANVPARLGINITPELNLDVAGSGRFSEGLSVKGTGYYGGDVTLAANLHLKTSTPSTGSAVGVAGTITWDSNYVYICTATNTWKRAAIATW